jgi:cyclopropane-fatty-acyl-phospholipid synthase
MKITGGEKPLDHDRAWELITGDWPPFVNWIRKHYPPTFMRKILLRRILNQDHALGIEDHYDVSKELFCLMLDKKYVAYSCADFIEDSDTLEDAQTRKFEHILSMLRPPAGEKILELGPWLGLDAKRGLRGHWRQGEFAGLYSVARTN